MKIQKLAIFLVCGFVLATIMAGSASAQLTITHVGNYGYFSGTGAELDKFFGDFAYANQIAHEKMVNEKVNGDRITEVTKYFYSHKNNLFRSNGGMDEIIQAHYPTGKISYPNRK